MLGLVLGSRSVTALNILGAAPKDGCVITKHATTWSRYVGGIMNTELRQVTTELIVCRQSLVILLPMLG